MRTRRAAYVVLAVATIALGLVVHRSAAFGTKARDVLGDALWAMMIAWWIGAVAPRVALMMRSTIALCICVAVELSQLIHLPALDAARQTTHGHLVLGSDFDLRDMAAYAAGVVVVAGMERAARALTT